MFECVEDFRLWCLDDNGQMDDEKYIEIRKGTFWEIDTKTTLSGADYGLINKDVIIEISAERLEQYFIEVY